MDDKGKKNGGLLRFFVNPGAGDEAPEVLTAKASASGLDLLSLPAFDVPVPGVHQIEAVPSVALEPSRSALDWALDEVFKGGGAEMGRAGRARVEREFAVEHHVAAIVPFFQRP